LYYFSRKEEEKTSLI